MKSDTTIPLKADEAAATLVEMLFRLQRDVAQMNRDDAFCEDLRVREPALYVENFHVTHVTLPQDLDPVKVFAMAAFAASPQHLH